MNTVFLCGAGGIFSGCDLFLSGVPVSGENFTTLGVG